MDAQTQYENSLVQDHPRERLIDAYKETDFGKNLTALLEEAAVIVAKWASSNERMVQYLMAETLLDTFGGADDQWTLRQHADRVREGEW